MSQYNDAALLIGRLLAAAIFLWSGIGKTMGYAGTAGYMQSAGVPSILLPLVIVLDIGGALALIVGWQARWAAVVLAGYTLVAGLLFHFKPGDINQTIHLMKNLAIAGGLMAFFVAGPGRLSLDRRGRM